jgi:hypothetical protein
MGKGQHFGAGFLPLEDPESRLPQRTRWAKAKAKSDKGNVIAMPKKRTMSAAGRRRIAAAQRARWAKVKAAKKSA